MEAACHCAAGPPLKIKALFVLCSLCACSTPPPLTAASAPAQPRPSSAQLQGLWVEYWAVNGDLDTQRYMFLDDGNFTWLAPRTFAGRSAMRKLGQFQLQANTLVLQVNTEEFAPCPTCGAAAAIESKRIEHASPMVERYELGECAPNIEAQAIDQHYACMAIDGRAFWRRPLPAADAPR